MSERVDVVIPCLPRDIETLRRTIPILRAYLPMSHLVVVGPDALQNQISRLRLADTVFIAEDSFVDTGTLKSMMSVRAASSRTGWYLQQFIKMGYALQCQDAFYLVWDADTIPCRPYSWCDCEGRPYFDVKEEFHKAYFDTIGRMFPGMKKVTPKSFISEHMLVATDLMCEMIEELGGEGAYVQRIMNAIDDDVLGGSGFSEFETFGTWCMTKHPDRYRLREWRSLRTGAMWFVDNNLPIQVINWIGKEYDAASFESWNKAEFSAKCRRWMLNPIMRFFLSVDQGIRMFKRWHKHDMK